MKMLTAVALLALALPPAGASAAPTVRKAVRHAIARPALPVDWTKRVALTAAGGYLVGNPAAKAKLVEYGSLSCPYCHLFYTEAVEPLTARIASGDVSFEYRPYAVHSVDPILHALLRCAGTSRFLRFYHDFYRDQPTLTSPWEMWSEANKDTNPNTGAATRIRYAGQWGLTAFATTHGLTKAGVNSCLSNNAAFTAQRTREDAAVTLGVNGTPSFLLNGKLVAASHWY